MWDLIISDPVVWGSMAGIGVMVAMAGYYIYLFVHNVKKGL
jgi:hypothetical protein